ncbi:GNAT family N-acetyltransferase [Vitreoscilla massiliensis]|uniref:GNAT family N-acetyltransferase n=1 Tax=Vitreoscilla massiliensis TaxID=1689272 RepID=A0ABY4E0N3_9NEIS|nr:GNAT family protein [Vitreoscilla massiliensis]UOO89333.1 GNAT family N-acetyltransferase [Vitreoscilla massiliensis]
MLTLRLFQATDMAALIAAVSDARMLMQFAGPHYHYPLTTAQIQADVDDGAVVLFSFIDANGRVVGHAQIKNLTDSFLLRRILIWDASFRGQGWGKWLVEQLLDEGFRCFAHDMAELNVFEGNVAARRCYQKVGFQIRPANSKTVTLEGETWRSLNMVLSRATYLKNSIHT